MAATMRAAYDRANEGWPGPLPALTDWEAIRAASRLWRWAMGSACPHEIRATSGNRRTWVRDGVLYVNPDQGWREFIHDLSHLVDWLANRADPTHRGHSKHHARVEANMVREVVRRGWLDGRLKEKARVVAPPTANERRARELERIAAAEKRWGTKAKRARTALAKLARRRRYYERAA